MMGADGLVLWRCRRRLHRSAWKAKPYRRNVIGIECGAGDEQYADSFLGDDSIQSATCPHRDWGQGDCGDPVCQILRSEALSWMADSANLKRMAEERMMDELDELEGADG